MIANRNFEGTIKGELKKFTKGDTLTAAEVKELNAESKGLVSPKTSTKEETKDDTTTT